MLLLSISLNRWHSMTHRRPHARHRWKNKAIKTMVIVLAVRKKGINMLIRTNAIFMNYKVMIIKVSQNNQIAEKCLQIRTVINAILWMLVMVILKAEYLLGRESSSCQTNTPRCRTPMTLTRKSMTQKLLGWRTLLRNILWCKRRWRIHWHLFLVLW